MTMTQTSWQTRPLAKCGDWVSGGTPSKSVGAYWNGTIPWISSKSLKSFDLSDSDDRVTSDAVANGTILVPKGTVIFVVRGMSLAKEFRVGVTTRQVAFNQDLRAIIPAKDIDGRYLAHFLKANEPVVLGLTNNASHGTKRLPTELLETFDVPVPSLSEQKRIAAILDKADAILRKRRETLRSTYAVLDALFYTMFGDVAGRRSPYPIKPLRPYMTAANGKSSKDVVVSDATGIPIYGGNGVSGWSVRALYHEPVVVVGRVGQQCGITHLTDGPSWITDNAIAVQIKDHNKLHIEYLEAALRRSTLGHDVRYIDLPYINQTMILDLPLPLPPIEKQLTFSKQKKGILRSLQTQTEHVHLLDRLSKSLVQRAFRGEL